MQESRTDFGGAVFTSTAMMHDMRVTEIGDVEDEEEEESRIEDEEDKNDSDMDDPFGLKKLC